MEKEAWRVFKCCRKYTIIFSLLGIAFSYYSIVVSEAKTHDSGYVALCDITSTIRCSDVLTSVYSKGFGIIGSILGENSTLYQSNGFYGLIFYTGTIILSLYPAEIFAKIFLIMSILSLLISAYLGYILIYVLKEFCVVCVFTYIYNCVLFILSIRNFGAVKLLKTAAQLPDYSSFLDGKSGKKRV